MQKYANDEGNFIEISDFCYETFPCFHDVSIDGGEIRSHVSAVEIYIFLEKNGLLEKTDGHFDYVAKLTASKHTSSSRVSLSLASKFVR